MGFLQVKRYFCWELISPAGVHQQIPKLCQAISNHPPTPLRESPSWWGCRVRLAPLHSEGGFQAALKQLICTIALGLGGSWPLRRASGRRRFIIWHVIHRSPGPWSLVNKALWDWLVVAAAVRFGLQQCHCQSHMMGWSARQYENHTCAEDHQPTGTGPHWEFLSFLLPCFWLKLWTFLLRLVGYFRKEFTFLISQVGGD